MFQGIIEQKGKIIRRLPSSILVRPEKPWKAKAGDSVAVNGVCLTVTRKEKGAVWFDLGKETQAVTSLRNARAGDWVNVERPLRLGDPVHGHLVLGHVETTAKVVQAAPNLKIKIKGGDGAAILPKGSLAVDGVSLTINRTGKNGIEFFLIPETLRRTNLGAKKPGDEVNIETDYLAKLALAAFKQEGEKRYGKNK